jgi:hypothetical protein
LYAAAGAAAAAVAATAVALSASGHAAALHAALLHATSGFAPAFSLIFLSELGDKTFFITALLAVRLGR